MLIKETGESLLQDIINNPDDLNLRLIYADWLEEYGSYTEMDLVNCIRRDVNDFKNHRLVRRANTTEHWPTPATVWIDGELRPVVTLPGLDGHAKQYAQSDSVIISCYGMVEAVIAPTCTRIPWEIVARNPVKWITIADRVPTEFGWQIGSSDTLFFNSNANRLPKPWFYIPWTSKVFKTNSTENGHLHNDLLYYAVPPNGYDPSISQSLKVDNVEQIYYELLSEFLIWYSRNGAGNSNTSLSSFQEINDG